MAKDKTGGSRPTQDTAAPDIYPGAYDIPSLKERRYLWTSRLLALVAVLSMLVNLTLGWTLAALMPLKEVRPFLVPLVEEGKYFTNIEPITKSLKSIDALSENLVRSYVMYRHEIVRSDPIMIGRWAERGFVDLMSDKTEYNRFRTQVATTLEELRKQDVTQEVTIKSVTRLQATGLASGNTRVYQVEFETVGRNASNVVIQNSRGLWQATLEITYRELEGVPYESRLVNPTGFTVLNYTLAKKAAQ